MKTITENKFKVIADCEVREIEIQLEGDAQLNVYKSILLRFAEDGENPISAISFNLEIKASVFSKASGTL